MLVAELLTQKPLAGSVTERRYDVSSGTNTWVLFGDPTGDSAPWAGVFGNAPVAFFSAAVPFADGRHVLVVARGQGYVGDGCSGRLVRKTSWDYSYSAVAVPGHDFVVVASPSELWATSLDGDRHARLAKPWFTRLDSKGRPIAPADKEPEVVALDGIVIDAVDQHELRGHAWWPDGWHPFRLDLDGWSLEEDDPITSVYEAFGAQPGKGGYPTSHEYYDWMARHWLQ